MPSSGGRSAPNRSNSAVIAASSAASAATSISCRASRGQASAPLRPAGRRGRDTATMVARPSRRAVGSDAGPMLPVAPTTRWLAVRVEHRPAVGSGARALEPWDMAHARPGTPPGPRRRRRQPRPARTARPDSAGTESSRSMMPPQISGCSSASVRPRPHKTAWAGLARSPSSIGLGIAGQDEQLRRRRSAGDQRCDKPSRPH